MAIKVNNIELPSEWSHSVRVNGDNVEKVYVNGELVWEYSEPCYSDCGSDCSDCVSDGCGGDLWDGEGDGDCSMDVCDDCDDCVGDLGCGSDYYDSCTNDDGSCDGCDSCSDDGNVICTWIIKNKLLNFSNENVLIGFKNGMPAKAFKEYRDDLGPKIIENLEKEDLNFIFDIWVNDITNVWKTLRQDGKKGWIEYLKFVKKLSEKYNIDFNKYKHLSNILKNSND